MSSLLQRLRGSRPRTPVANSQSSEERRGSNRRPLEAPVICIPIENRSAKQAYAVGIHWCHHLMEEPLLTAANRAAKSKGCSHLYTNGRNGTVYGILNVDPKDVSQHGTLIPLAVAFAKSVPDKNSRAIYVFDMRDSATEGFVFFAVVQRGNPIKEILCPAEKYFGLLNTLANDSSTPAAIFVDTPEEDTFDYIASAYASATQWPISKLDPSGIDGIHRAKVFNFSRTQIVMAFIAVAVGVGYTYGIDYYKANLQAKSDEELQRKIANQYALTRNQTFLAGYGGTPVSAIEALQATVEKMPMNRNGWTIKQAVCLVDAGTCVYEWERVYGTNDSFVESASLPTLKFDPTNYRAIKEEREFKVIREVQDWNTLPEVSKFVRDNGDRKDTFALAGIDEFNTELMTDLVPWTGRGAPPGPVLTTAAWSFMAPIDQVQEAIANQRIGKEFGVNTLTITNRDGTIILKLEGKVYARKS